MGIGLPRIHIPHRMFALVIGAVVLLAGTACGSGASSAVDTARMQELGNEFVEQLDSTVIAMREKPERLLGLEAVVVLDDKTYHLDRLYSFYEDYRVGEDTELLLVFQTKSFVVNKIVFEGSAGYYYRYEYDQFNPNAINVSSQPLDKLTITENSSLNKAELTLLRDKMADIVVTFCNIVTEEELEQLLQGAA